MHRKLSPVGKKALAQLTSETDFDIAYETKDVYYFFLFSSQLSVSVMSMVRTAES